MKAQISVTKQAETTLTKHRINFSTLSQLLYATARPTEIHAVHLDLYQAATEPYGDDFVSVSVQFGDTSFMLFVRLPHTEYLEASWEITGNGKKFATLDWHKDNAPEILPLLHSYSGKIETCFHLAQDFNIGGILEATNCQKRRLEGA
jgi:hypothetical protein